MMFTSREDFYHGLRIARISFIRGILQSVVNSAFGCGSAAQGILEIGEICVSRRLS
jgi:hypothetical protein